MKSRNLLLSLPLVALVLASTGCMESSAASRTAQAEDGPQRARAMLVPIGGSGVTGEVTFVRTDGGVKVTAELEGLAPGKHGFHIHQYGDLSDRQTGKSAGGHFAPEGEPHGAPSADQRHVGDLGNIEVGADGRATLERTDSHIALSGPHSIVGRAVVVHEGEDTFGQPSGNAGGRVAFGVIGIAEAQ